MSDEERESLEEGRFEVEELDDKQLEDIAGGDNGSQCLCGSTVNESQCG